MKRFGIILGSMIWGLLVFRIALGIHFPVEDIQNRIRVEVDKSTKSSMQLKIGNMSLASLIGLQANNVILYKNDVENPEEEDERVDTEKNFAKGYQETKFGKAMDDNNKKALDVMANKGADEAAKYMMNMAGGDYGRMRSMYG